MDSNNSINRLEASNNMAWLAGLRPPKAFKEDDGDDPERFVASMREFWDGLKVPESLEDIHLNKIWKGVQRNGPRDYH